MNLNFKLGAWLQLGSLKIFSIINDFKFDFIVIDIEHGSKDNLEIYPQILKNNVKLYIRTSSRDSAFISWLLDIGYHGIIFSNIKNDIELEILINSMFFPPIGKRGVGYCASNIYGKYINDFINNEKPFLGIQIESKEGINNLNKILEKYNSIINCCLLGPYDLSNDLGFCGDFKNEIFVYEKNRYLDILKKFRNIKKGIHIVTSNYEDVIEAANIGYDFISYSTDGLLIIDSLRKINKL